MDYRIIVATKADLEVLPNLFQFYIYDFSKFMDVDVEENGRYSEYPLNDYWTEQNYFAYLIKSNEKFIGFVLVIYINTDKKSYNSIVEFFIMEKYQRYGLGKLVAKEIFSMHRGEWGVF
ncbi:GNAT family N-acetyltransferase [Bacillus sp. 1P06AnD]|uniref:GNAT family N-acetyltransferase n=1 Tax=Bacillus sp. 1P06AnD TaxID=3132208 RepID=UPI0039A29D6F